MKKSDIVSWLVMLVLFSLITVIWYIYTNRITIFPSPGPKYITTPIHDITPTKPLVIPSIFILAVFSLVYFLVYKGYIDRTLVFVIAAVAVVILGNQLKFYDWDRAWQSLKNKIDVIYFLVGMNIISVVLAEGGLFEYLAKKAAVATKGNKWKIMFAFCLTTYAVSLLVNNLTTIIVLVPMVFSLSRLLKFDPKPFVIGMIIASNLGGASTMIGDFPNMLIGTVMRIPFISFILYMMPICFVQLCVLLVYIRISYRELFAVKKKPAEKKLTWLQEIPQLAYTNGASPMKNTKEEFFQKLKESLQYGLKNPKMVKRGLYILGALLVLFIISDLISISPAIIALLGGLAALFFSGANISSILERLNYKDIFFFSALFILVGAAEASGIIRLLGEIITYISGTNTLLCCLILMWTAAIATGFLNAGPTTALFLPLVVSFIQPNAISQNYIYFWALSLGVLAGSSATLTGATAGSVSANMLNDFVITNKHEYKNSRINTNNKIYGGSQLSFKEYAQTGVPVAVMFLIISSIYLTIL